MALDAAQFDLLDRSIRALDDEAVDDLGSRSALGALGQFQRGC